MLSKLNQWSKGRTAWLLLALTALALELTAYWFQHVMLLKPCVLCIYQRAGLAGLILAGLVGAIAPRTPLRFVALFGWIIAVGYTLSVAWEQTMLQLQPPLFATCDFAAKFPNWLPLDKWLPSFFVASGDCLDRAWVFLNMSMPQWLVAVCVGYLVVAALVLLAQLPRFSRR